MMQLHDASCSMSLGTAQFIWEEVSGLTAIAGDLHHRAVVKEVIDLEADSIYGVVQSALGLNDPEYVTEMAKQGRLPAIVVAYYLVSKAYTASSQLVLLVPSILALVAGFLHPIALKIAGQAAFGVSSAEQAIHALRL